MRLKISRAASEERLVGVLNTGYSLLQELREDYARVRGDPENRPAAVAGYNDRLNAWGAEVFASLDDIFPTELEWNKFLNPPFVGTRVSVFDDRDFNHFKFRFEDLLNGLVSIRESDLDRYTDLPVRLRLYVEDIDSFQNVRDVNWSEVASFLDKDGVLQLAEDTIQQGIEQILDEVFHKKDWGGEINDLYSSQVRVSGKRVATAFMLKGNGLRKAEMRLGDCGKNGDQIQRLFNSPAQLFVVQFVGQVGEDVITDVHRNVELLRLKDKPGNYLIMNGQDTARVLFAYGKLRA
jgi:hypothetical protein